MDNEVVLLISMYFTLSILVGMGDRSKHLMLIIGYSSVDL